MKEESPRVTTDYDDDAGEGNFSVADQWPKVLIPITNNLACGILWLNGGMTWWVLLMKRKFCWVGGIFL